MDESLKILLDESQIKLTKKDNERNLLCMLYVFLIVLSIFGNNIVINLILYTLSNLILFNLYYNKIEIENVNDTKIQLLIFVLTILYDYYILVDNQNIINIINKIISLFIKLIIIKFLIIN